jgi:DNA-binding XRE family transcriptional regulator
METELRDLLALTRARLEEVEKQVAARDVEIAMLQAQLTKAKSRTAAIAVASSFAPRGPRTREYTLPVVAKPGTRLKKLRERLGLTQFALGERLGIARTTVANYENGRAPLSKQIRKWIAVQEGNS